MQLTRIVNAVTHLRIPFSVFLMPVFLLALIPVENVYTQQTVWLFVALHVFVYPASNAVNSYYDQDEGPIGGIENPPDADALTLWVGLAFNLIGLAICAVFVNWVSAVGVLLYSAVSFGYSYPGIRFKADPLLSTFSVAVFQGPVVALSVWAAAGYSGIGSLEGRMMLAASALLLAGSYPLTQLYQIEEDTRRGDHTIASRLGPMGTLNFSGAAFAGFAACMYFGLGDRFQSYWPFLAAAMLPGAIGVGVMVRALVRDGLSGITFRMVMWQNMVSSSAFIVAHIAFLAWGRG